MDHKRKAWWTIDLLRSENHEINWNKYYADCEEVESREWRKAFKILVDNYIAENADIKFNYENKNSMTPGRRYWLIFIIRIILSFGIFLGISYNHQFGKEYSSCNAGDGPPKKDINTDRSRPRSNTLPIPLTVNCSPPSILVVVYYPRSWQTKTKNKKRETELSVISSGRFNRSSLFRFLFFVLTRCARQKSEAIYVN
jgi:hypothetical protein